MSFVTQDHNFVSPNMLNTSFDDYRCDCQECVGSERDLPLLTSQPHLNLINHGMHEEEKEEKEEEEEEENGEEEESCQELMESKFLQGVSQKSPFQRRCSKRTEWVWGPSRTLKD